VQKKEKNKAKPFCSTPGKGHSETTVLGRQPSCLDSTSNCALGGIEGISSSLKMTYKGKFLQTLSFPTACGRLTLLLEETGPSVTSFKWEISYLLS